MRCLAFILLLRLASPFTRSPALSSLRQQWAVSSVRVSTAAFSTSSALERDDTVVELKRGNQLVTLVGTAHLSKASKDQVTAIIESTQPDSVMVELDPSRLKRIGIASTKDLGLPFATAEDIQVPLKEDDKLPTPWWMPLQNFLLSGFSKVGRTLLTGMYNDMGDSMGEVGGGEFRAAIEAAKKTPSCQKIILGDRDSLITLRRAAELAIRSGDPLGVMTRLSEANDAETNELQQRVLDEAPDKADDEAYMTRATIEALKADSGIRNRIFERLEKDVPEFSRAFITERDYIMAEAIQRELSSGAKHVVGVVGLAHVPGISANLETAWRNETTQ